MNEKTVYCSFCGAGQNERKTMIAGPDVAICNVCVFQSVEILVGDSVSEVLSKALLFAWVAADTIHSPHPTCVSSLAYMSQLDKDRGREYVPLYAAPVAAQAPRPCTCHPDDRPRGPCREKYASNECLAAAVDVEELLGALRQIAEWPDGGERYGQGNIKRFAQAAIDAAMQRTSAQEGSKQ